MKYLVIIISLLFFSCHSQTKYPEGGFDYPKNVSNNDTNFYYYPLKDIESKKDAFQDSYAFLFYQSFDEPNLSIKPQPKDIFRLTYGGTFRESVIITFTEDGIIVKKGSPSIIYYEDTSHLTEIEKFHLALLKRRFPIDTSGRKPIVKHYLDSLTKLYPQLLDPNYYHNLYNKTITRNGEKFTYLITKINLTKQQYELLVQQINSSGFWSMPYKIDCQDPPMDGDSFTLEANTKKKYKIVTVGGCPDDTTKLTKACQKLIEFAKMDKEIHLIWSGKIVTGDSVVLPDIRK
ncbi:MAG TPA: hypothetical protein VKR58_08435 [Aquella sp.]|nr:hypothetical protein [Aquella sp.]